MQKDGRLRYLHVSICIISAILILRLFYIQVVSGQYYSKMAAAQKISPFSERIRGEVMDRSGEPLTGSYYETYAVISPGWLTESQKRFLFEKHILSSSYVEKPQNIKISQENTGIIKELFGRTPGVFMYKKKIRYGPEALATHVVGYNGKAGVEKTFNGILSGTKDQSRINIVNDGYGQPIAGASNEEIDSRVWGVKLTLDKKIQSIVEKIMDEKVEKGAAVVLDANTGEILAMASRPNYKQYRLKDYLDRQGAPLINRAVEGFAPGSIFKIIVLSAALEENITSLEEEFICPGYIKVGGNTFKCSSYEEGGHGRITLKDAMAHSCNSVFIELGMRLGREKILEYARRFGLGEKVSIGLPEEKRGFIPQAEEVYYADLGNISIGQGSIEITPLQAAQMVLAIVNKGVMQKPYLIKEIVDLNGNIIKAPVVAEGKRIVSEGTSEKVRETLEAVTKYGTGIYATPDKKAWQSAGKTGTAEIKKNTYHAWFVGYFPAKNPRYVISIFVEEGGSGPTKAAPVFREVAERLIEFNRE